MTRRMDLNADLGELPGSAGRASDRAVLDHVTSCAIACGGHAGDEKTMAATLVAAKAAGVQAGAHPSYPDQAGFGRTALRIGRCELAASLTDQIRILADLAAGLDMGLTHIKPHGALYNEACRDPALAGLVVEVSAAALPGAALVGQPGGALQMEAEARGIRFLGEGFIDRTYRGDGTLTARSEVGALIEDPQARVRQALQIALEGQAFDATGGPVRVVADTLCLHGDSPDAAHTAREIASALRAGGVELAAPGLP